MIQKKYTPATIEGSFAIPLYQRLFEWEEKEIYQLLRDLYSGFCESPGKPYYIGILTVKKTSENKYDLVDGQQRFTVLSLIGIAFGWKEFLLSNNESRLSFFARKNDQEYLINKIEGRDLDYVNVKMEAGIEYIQKFVEDLNTASIESFKNYVKSNTTFFLSELPQNYTIQNLNRYFEAMNETGKGLENHEILKVQLLRHINDSKKEKFTKIWNLVCDMDVCLIKKREGELQKNYKNRIISILSEDRISSHFFQKDKESGKLDNFKISQIEANPNKPNSSANETNENSILSFSEFLLQILWISLPKEERQNSTIFFNKFRLLEIFQKHIINIDLDSFYENLLKYRVLFDYFIIRLNSQDIRNTNYSLNMVEEIPNDVSNFKGNLIQYQSMLYVSLQLHTWLTPFLEYLNKNFERSAENCLDLLKNWDNKRLDSSSDINLAFGKINRYWFWRLDYYLWENRNKYFEEENSRRIANNYIFRTNRSIEHISPQTPKHESKIELDKEIIHSFGNLVMISAGQNSSLKNESFEVKKAHVDSFVNESVGGSIESLKMLRLYSYQTWNKENLMDHQNDMIGILINSFDYSDNTCGGVIKKLQEAQIQLTNA